MRIWVLGFLLAASLPALADNAPVIDNDRITVWDVRLNPHDSGPAAPRDLDSVVMVLEGGRVRTVLADGSTHVTARRFGQAQTFAKGSGERDTLLSGGPLHEVLVALKDKSEPPAPNPGGLPLAFPRPGSVKVLETPRLIVWHYSWTRGQPTPMHFHDKDVVVAYRHDGTLRSVTPGGDVTDNPYKAGDIRFNKSNRSHSEDLISGRQSAVILELK